MTLQDIIDRVDGIRSRFERLQRSELMDALERLQLDMEVEQRRQRATQEPAHADHP